MTTKNFKITLSNASTGKIVKDVGLITIGEAPEDLPDVPPTLLDPENLNQWECVWDNKNNANVYSVNHVAESGYEYILFINASSSDDELCSTRFFFGEEYENYPNSSYLGQGALDHYAGYVRGKFLASTNEYFSSANVPIKALYRRPFKLISDESLRVNPGEWETIQKTEIKKSQFNWKFGYEYVFAVRDVQNGRMYYFWGYNDVSILSKSSIDKKRPLVMPNNRADNKLIFFVNKNGKTNPSLAESTLIESNMSGLDDKYLIHRVYRRPTDLGVYPDREPSSVSWHKVFSSSAATGDTYFEWQEGKEYLFIALDSDGTNEGASCHFMIVAGALAKYGFSKSNGYAAITGDNGWIRMHYWNNRKRLTVSNGARIYDIYERDLTFDEFSCADDSSGPVNISGEWTNSQVAVNAYDVSSDTGYRDNTFYLAANRGIDSDGNLAIRPGIVSIIVVEDSTVVPELGSLAYGVLELTRFSSVSDSQDYNWNGSISYNPTEIPIKVNGSSAASSIDVDSDLIKFEIEGLGVSSQVLFNINFVMTDESNNTESFLDLQIIVNKTVSADSGSAYLRSDEIV